jgi:hypothetical protein
LKRPSNWRWGSSLVSEAPAYSRETCPEPRRYYRSVFRRIRFRGPGDHAADGRNSEIAIVGFRAFFSGGLNTSRLTPVNRILSWPPTTARLQRRFNRFLTNCPETISVKDNLVSGLVVQELPFATEGTRANDGCLAATLGPSRLMAFRLFITSIVVGGGDADAYDWSGFCSPGTTSPTSVGGGTRVGWLVSMIMRSGAAELKLFELRAC